jgi:selenocysteine lyase/cysteine desulfurase
VDELRREFPVLEHVAYLNAGTNGPVPARAAAAARASLEVQVEQGRSGKALFEGMLERFEELRRRAAAMLGCDSGEVALTGSTTDGVNAVLTALDLEAGDEVLTSDEEHPGVLAPLGALRERRGIEVRVAPFGSIADAVSPATRLVATSHVSWITGQVVDCAALAATGVPVLLDGAQSLGAIPVNVRELGCDFYAAAGQKWMCGPNGTGYLYVRRERVSELPPAWPSYGTLADPHDPLHSAPHGDARRFDMAIVPPHHAAWALASLDVLDSAPGGRAAALAARFADMLRERRRTLAPRGDSTLVSWKTEDPPAETERLLGEGFVVRHLPGTSYVRASVGAWSTEDELERLAATSGP